MFSLLSVNTDCIFPLRVAQFGDCTSNDGWLLALCYWIFVNIRLITNINNNLATLLQVSKVRCLMCSYTRYLRKWENACHNSQATTGRFINFSVITNIYNRKTKGSTLMELFTATGKLKAFYWQLEMFDVCTTGDTAHIDMKFKFLSHTRQHACIDILHCCNDPCL